MDTSQSVDLLVNIIGGILAILVLINNLIWSRRYKAATEATIASKDDRIKMLEGQNNFLKELTAPKLREILIAERETAQERISMLEGDNVGHRSEISELNFRLETANAENEIEKQTLKEQLTRIEETFRQNNEEIERLIAQTKKIQGYVNLDDLSDFFFQFYDVVANLISGDLAGELITDVTQLQS